MSGCTALVHGSVFGEAKGDPFECGDERGAPRHTHDWTCEFITGLGDGHDNNLHVCHEYQGRVRKSHGLHTWDDKPRIGQSVVTDYWDSDGEPTTIVRLKLASRDGEVEQGAWAKVHLPDGKLSRWVSIAWLVPA